MHKKHSIRSINFLHMILLYAGIIIISNLIIRFNELTLNDWLYYIAGIVCLYIASIVFLIKKEIRIDNEVLRITSSSQTPFIKTVSKSWKWSEIKSIQLNPPFTNYRDPFDVIELSFHQSKSISLAVWSYSKDKKTLINIHKEIKSKLSYSQLANAREEVEVTIKSVFHAGYTILKIAVVITLISIFLYFTDILDISTQKIGLFATLSFIISMMSVGLIMHFKNKNSSSEN
ncbi:MAG: hypothetical protein ACI9N1_000922 [Flavobacteriales bacterium]